MERQLIAEYETLLDEIARLKPRDAWHGRRARCAAGADPRLRPGEAAAIEKAKLREKELLERLHGTPPERRQAA